MTNKISRACSQKSLSNGIKESKQSLCLLALTRTDSLGLASQHSVKSVCFWRPCPIGRKAWEGDGRWGHVCVHLSVYDVGMGLLPEVLAGWHQAYPPAQVHETGVVGCPAQGETTPPGIPGPSPVGPSLWTLFLLLPSYFQSFCHFFLFSTSWTKVPFAVLITESSAEEKQSRAAQMCSCAGLSGVLGRHCCLKARRLRSLGSTTSHPPHRHSVPWAEPQLTLGASLRCSSSI